MRLECLWCGDVNQFANLITPPAIAPSYRLPPVGMAAQIPFGPAPGQNPFGYSPAIATAAKQPTIINTIANPPAPGNAIDDEIRDFVDAWEAILNDWQQQAPGGGIAPESEWRVYLEVMAGTLNRGSIPRADALFTCGNRFILYEVSSRPGSGKVSKVLRVYSPFLTNVFAPPATVRPAPTLTAVLPPRHITA
jgi:hypothetical protein